VAQCTRPWACPPLACAWRSFSLLGCGFLRAAVYVGASRTSTIGF